MVLLFVLVSLTFVKSQNEFSFVTNYPESRCLTNSSFALTWIYKDLTKNLDITSVFIPNGQYSTLDISNTSQFEIQNSLQGDISQLILDHRWEGLKTYVTGSDTKKPFTAVLSDLNETFIVPLSIRIPKEAHIFLCNGIDVYSSDCYWLLLQSYSGSKTAFRICQKDKNSTMAENNCLLNLNVKNHPYDRPPYLSENEWRHFVIEKNSRHLRLYKTGFRKSDILKIPTNNYSIEVTHMIINSINVIGLWKVHQRDYIYTENEVENVQLGPKMRFKNSSLCVFMFISMCASCRIKLGFEESGETVKEEIFETDGTKWHEIKFFSDRVSSDEVAVLVSTNGSTEERQFWAIDNLRQCVKEEYRMISSQTIESCQLLTGTPKTLALTTNIQPKIYDRCPDNSIGKLCIPCSWLFPNGCNQKTSICEYGHGCSSSGPGNSSLLVIFLSTLAVVLLGAGLLVAWCLVRKSKSKRKTLNITDSIPFKRRTIFSKPTLAKKFSDYVETAFNNGDLVSECLAVLKHISQSIYAEIEGNLTTRHVDLWYSDETCIPKAYLIGRVPKKHEIKDFWKLLWDENIKNIILIDDPKSRNKIYWPRDQLVHRHGDISIQLLITKSYIDFEHRKFLLNSKGEIRQLDQYHLISWVHGDVPISALNFAPFFKEICRVSPNPESPIFVHSSSGPMGAGFALLCDMTLKNVDRNGVVDLFRNFHILAEISPDLISDDTRYYLFAHLLILECLSTDDTSINCNTLVKNVAKHRSYHLDYIKSTVWLDGLMRKVKHEDSVYHRSVGLDSNNRSRIVSYFPEEVNDPYTKKLNATYLNILRLGTLIVTKEPTLMTLELYWKLVEANDVSVIVSLQNCGSIFWPTENHPLLRATESVTVQFEQMKSNGFYDWISLKCNYNKNQQKTLQVFVFTAWNNDEMVPPNVPNFVEFCIKSAEFFANSKSVIVTCCDGVVGGGLYFGTLYNISKIKLEGVCDVGRIVRIVRSYHEHFLENEEQQNFLYEAAKNYIRKENR